MPNICEAWGDAGDARVLSVEPLDTKYHKGSLATLCFDDVKYETQAVLMDGGGVLESQIDDRRKRSGMPEEFMCCTGKDFDWALYGSHDISVQKNTVNAFIFNFTKLQEAGRGLYIHSCSGSGKTMLSCCVANEVLERQDIPVKYVTVAEYWEAARNKGEYNETIQRSIFDSGLLILDGIGTSLANRDYVSDAVFRLVDRRHSRKRPTIFIGYSEINSLKADPRIVRMIRQRCIPVALPNVDVSKAISDAQTKEFFQSITK